MTRHRQQPPWPRLIYWTLLGGALTGGPGWGQAEPGQLGELWREPVLGRDFYPLPAADRPGEVIPPASRVPRVRLFRMPAGFLNGPLGLDAGDEPAAAGPADFKTSPAQDDVNFIQVNIGLDNPFFDYRLPGDPGGVGYYKIYSQLQLFDLGKSCLSLNLQAVTPAGVEGSGLPDGPTVLSPALAWFQELGDGAALQGFVGKNIRAYPRWTDDLERRFEYGMALQCAIPGLNFGTKTSVHFFLEALGRYGNEADPGTARPVSWELIPGIHCRVGEKWWVSVGAARTSVITCSWQF